MSNPWLLGVYTECTRDGSQYFLRAEPEGGTVNHREHIPWTRQKPWVNLFVAQAAIT